MLKIKFTRNKNIVIMEVLEQGSEIVRGSGRIFKGDNGIEIHTAKYPQIIDNKIYVRGDSETKDEYLSCCEFSSVTLAQQFYKRAIETVEGYNLSHSSAQDYETTYEDVETYITG